MEGGERGDPSEQETLAGVARIARVLVGIGGLTELGRDAMVETRDVLGLDLAALYVTDEPASHVLRCIEKLTAPGSRVDVNDVVSLDPEAWQFVVASGGPLVFRESAAWLMENPFRPPLEHWVVLPLVSQTRMLGAIVGGSAEPISLGPAAVARFTVIGDLLSAGAENAMLRAELQRTELQRERMRLAEDIHDSLAQDLAAAVRELALLETRPSPDVALASEERLREAVHEAHRIVRRHLDVLAGDAPVAGLAAGVDDVCARYRRRGLAVTSAVQVHSEIDPARVAVVLRVLNEALANVQRHAGVSEASVSLTDDASGLRLSIDDRGDGFDAEASAALGNGHFGLAIMRQRARAAGGALTVRSRPREGTTVELSLPRESSPG